MPDVVTSALLQFSKWLVATPFSLALTGMQGSIALLQTVHILAVAAVLSSACIINLRVLGLFATDRPRMEQFSRFIPVIWVGLVVLLVSGALLIIMEPVRSLLSWPFQLKMTMLLAVIILTVVSHRSAASHARPESTNSSPRLAPQMTAGVSLLLWLAIVVLGRWIAYA